MAPDHNYYEIASLILDLKPLLTTGKFAEAALQIAALRDRMLAENDTEAAADLTSFLATIAIAQDVGFDPVGFNSEEEFRRVEELSNQPRHKRFAAQRLLKAGKLDEAEAKLDEAERGTLQNGARQTALDLRGQIAFHRGDLRRACDALEQLLQLSRAENRHAGQWEFSLVETLVRSGACKDVCRQYLETILMETKKISFPPVEQRCVDLLRMLDADGER